MSHGSGADRAADEAARPRSSRSWWQRTRPKLTIDRVSFVLVFLFVPLAIYLTLVISPFIQAIGYSFTNWGGFSNKFKYIGFSNYQRLFTDDAFLKALGNNIIFAILIPTITVVLSLILAVFVTIGGSNRGNVRGVRGSGFYRTVSFFPYVIPAIIIGIMWSFIYQPNGGLLNGFGDLIGLDKVFAALGLPDLKTFDWLGSYPWIARFAVIVAVIWGFVGFYMVLFVAAIKDIPAEIFEAARIDGAGRGKMITRITVPLIRENVQTAYVYMGIAALDLFVYMSMMGPAGGPQGSLDVISMRLYDEAFRKGHFGLASAMGVVLAVVTLLFSALVFGVNRLTGGKEVAR